MSLEKKKIIISTGCTKIIWHHPVMKSKYEDRKIRGNWQASDKGEILAVFFDKGFELRMVAEEETAGANQAVDLFFLPIKGCRQFLVIGLFFSVRKAVE